MLKLQDLSYEEFLNVRKLNEFAFDDSLEGVDGTTREEPGSGGMVPPVEVTGKHTAFPERAGVGICRSLSHSVGFRQLEFSV